MVHATFIAGPQLTDLSGVLNYLHNLRENYLGAKTYFLYIMKHFLRNRYKHLINDQNAK